jgi:hypothetical protein
MKSQFKPFLIIGGKEITRMSELAVSQETRSIANTEPSSHGNIQPFSSTNSFESAQRMAKALSESTMVPTQYQKNIPNCLIALEIAYRSQSSILMVMQNLFVIQGKPSWSSQYIIAALNASGKFSPLRFKMNEEKTECTAWAIEHKTGETLEGPTVSIQMAKDEGWYNKNGSKWKTMPDLMLRYRAAAFFGRLYAPEVLMGIYTKDEVEDFHVKEVKSEIEPTRVIKPQVKVEEPKTEEVVLVSEVESEVESELVVEKSNELPWQKYMNDPQMVK